MDSDFDEASQEDIDKEVQEDVDEEVKRRLDAIFPRGEIIVLRSAVDLDKFFRNKMQRPGSKLTLTC